MSHRFQDPRTQRGPVTAASLRTELLVDAVAAVLALGLVAMALL